MKKTTLIVCTILASFGMITFSNSSIAQVKQKITIDVKGKSVPKTRGNNPNIKGRAEAPTVDKAESKSRGAVCEVNFDNFTGLYIKVFVDGNYEGTVSPYSDGTVTVGSGYTTIYCVSSGGTVEWTSKGNCDGEYVYNLKYSTAD